VESELGRWEAAGEAYRESLGISRRLAREIGETPQALEDLGISFSRLADLARSRNDATTERGHLRDALDAFTRASGAAPSAVRLEGQIASVDTRLKALDTAIGDTA
jgi:hypothetical protein